MEVRPVPARSGGRRERGLALAVFGLIFAATLCFEAGSLLRTAWLEVLRPGPASADQALGALAGSVATGVLVWLTGALALSLLAALMTTSGAAGALVTRVASSIAPLIVRNCVAALLGVSIVAVPTSALASASTPPSRAVVASVLREPTRPHDRRGPDEGLSPSWAPTVTAKGGDAQVLPNLSPAFAPAESSAGPIQQNLSPGWLPTVSPTADRYPKATPPATNPTLPAPRRTTHEDDDEVVVRRGDTLWDIAARQLGPTATDAVIAGDWPHWFSTNRAVIGNDPDRLRPGMRLRAPHAAIEGARSARAGGSGPGPDVGPERRP